MDKPLPDNVRRLRRPNGAQPSTGRRLRANWPAELRCNGKRLKCTVIDISSTGARLRLEEVVKDLHNIRLIIDNIPPIAALLAWRRNDNIGLEFLAEQQWIYRAYAQRFDPAAWLRRS